MCLQANDERLDFGLVTLSVEHLATFVCGHDARGCEDFVHVTTFGKSDVVVLCNDLAAQFVLGSVGAGLRFVDERDDMGRAQLLADVVGK